MVQRFLCSSQYLPLADWVSTTSRLLRLIEQLTEIAFIL
jgi:hypothetical protein